MPDGLLAGNMFVPVDVVTNHKAAATIRTLWEAKKPAEIAQSGLVLDDFDLKFIGSGQSGSKSRVLTVSAQLADGRSVLALLHADGSALVLVEIKKDANKYQALPIILSLEKTVRFHQDKPSLQTSVKSAKGKAPQLCVRPAKGAKPSEVQQGSAIEAIAMSAAAWAAEIDALPVSYKPADDPRLPPEGPLTREICDTLDLPHSHVGRPYTCPAFLDYCGITGRDTEKYKLLGKEIALWMVRQAPPEIDQIEIMIYGGRLSQTKTFGPSFHVNASEKDTGHPNPHWSVLFGRSLKQICSGALAPVSPEHLIAQIPVGSSNDPMGFSHIGEALLVYSHASKEDLDLLSNHEIMALEAKFSALTLRHKENQCP
jgi:hypothetical protein